jgi:tetratricopeptide (TPR) repeat protein
MLKDSVLKDYQQAKSLIKQSLIIYEQYYGKEHTETAHLLKDLGLVCLREGQLGMAEELLIKACKIFQQSKHPDTYLFLESLTELFLEKSSVEMNKGNTPQSNNFKNQAINYLKQALVIVKEHFSADSPHIVRIQNRLKAVDNKTSVN